MYSANAPAIVRVVLGSVLSSDGLGNAESTFFLLVSIPSVLFLFVLCRHAVLSRQQMTGSGAYSAAPCRP